MEVSGQLHDLVALSLGKIPQYPLSRRLVGFRSRSGPFETRTILALPGLETNIIHLSYSIRTASFQFLSNHSAIGYYIL